MVSIAAFQAVDPGSIPGRRRMEFCPSLPHGLTSQPCFPYNGSGGLERAGFAPHFEPRATTAPKGAFPLARSASVV